MDRDGNRSNLYKPNPAKCCERCAFGRGEHAAFCRHAVADHVFMTDATEDAIAEIEGPVDLHRFDDDGGAHH